MNNQDSKDQITEIFNQTLAKQMGKGKASHSLFLQRQPKNSYDNFCEIQADILSKKLKKKTFQNTIDHSRLTNHSFANMKDSKNQSYCINDYQSNQSLYYAKRKKQKIAQNFEEQYSQVLQILNEVLGRQKRLVESDRNLQENLMIDIEVLTKTIDEIRFKSEREQDHRELFIFTDILHKNYAVKESILTHQRSRKTTFNSNLKDGSLLLSFKRNLEEQDGYMTFKYSEQSNIKAKEKMSQSISQHYERVKKKLQFRDQPQTKNTTPNNQENGEGFIFNFVRDEIISLFEPPKIELNVRKQEGSKAISMYENLLDKIIQQIAEQKVITDESWKQISENMKNKFNSISKSLKQMIQLREQVEDELSTYYQEIQFKFQMRVVEQSKERKNEEKLMIKMMMEVVQFLQ